MNQRFERIKFFALTLAGLHFGLPAIHAQSSLLANAVFPENAFFEILKSGTPSPRKFIAESAPPWDVPKLTDWLSPNGLVIVEASKKSTRKFSKEQFTSELRNRKGPVFLILSHMSFLLSHPRPQYSKHWFEERHAARVGVIATFYEVTFEQGPNGPKVSKIEDINRLLAESCG